MRRVTQKSIKDGRITLTIPNAYKDVADIANKTAKDLGKPLSTFIWEIVSSYVQEEAKESRPASSKRLAGSLKKYALSYTPLSDVREQVRKEIVQDVAKEGLSS